MFFFLAIATLITIACTRCIPTTPINPGVNYFPQVIVTDHVLGDLTKADVVVITYMDAGSPYCHMFNITMRQIVQQNGTRVAWVYRHFPIFQDFRPTVLGMEYISSVQGNSAFWQSVDSFYTIEDYSSVRVTEIARSFSIDSTTFWNSIQNPVFSQKLADDSIRGIQSNILGVPHSFVYNKRGDSTQIAGAVDITEVNSIIRSLF